MATKSLKQRAAEVMGLVTPDTVLAIDPTFAQKADKAEAEGQQALNKAGALTTKANNLLVAAASNKDLGDRKLNAVKAFRKATGGN